MIFKINQIFLGLYQKIKIKEPLNLIIIGNRLFYGMEIL